jgi:ADP-heptose:LPS heptosyltransferase
LTRNTEEVLVHIGAGIGNVVLATPLLVALRELHFTTDIWLTSDYAQTRDLLWGWGAVRAISTDASLDLRSKGYKHVIAAIPPFYWSRYASRFPRMLPLVPRPSDSLFYQDEQEFYLTFARRLGFPPNRKLSVCLPIAPSEVPRVGSNTLVIAPGCKTGEMAAKRWPYFSELADRFDDVAIVGTSDDMQHSNGKLMRFGSHVKSFVDRLTLRETAEVIAEAGAFVGNDSGLSHIAAAVGTSTVMIFGPTPDQTLGGFPPNVRVLRRHSACEPCWFNSRFHACAGRIDCLAEIPVDVVVSLLAELGFVRDCLNEDGDG